LLVPHKPECAPHQKLRASASSLWSADIDLRLDSDKLRGPDGTRQFSHLEKSGYQRFAVPALSARGRKRPNFMKQKAA
jgi:hypothetical protein